MKIAVKRDFFDKRENLRLRRKGEILEADPERAEELISMKIAERVQEAEPKMKQEAAG